MCTDDIQQRLGYPCVCVEIVIMDKGCLISIITILSTVCSSKVKGNISFFTTLYRSTNYAGFYVLPIFGYCFNL